jgi:hypothetical protein
MNLWRFRHRFNREVLAIQDQLQPLSTREGWANARVQHTINLAVQCLKGTQEAYLEVGCFKGKSLEAACHDTPDVVKYGCDIEFHGSLKEVVDQQHINFFHEDFGTLDIKKILHPVGVFYLDNDHSYENTYGHLKRAISVLANKALVFVDDHAYARSYNAVRDFVRDHAENFTIVHEMWPECDIFRAMTNHCLNDWYNGWVILEYERQPGRLPNELDDAVLGGFHCRSEGPYPVGWEDVVKKVTG